MARNSNSNRAEQRRKAGLGSKAARKAAKRQAKIDPVAALLLDPCNGDPTAPFYNGEGGYSQRFVKTFTVTTGATDTALNFAFFPGAMMTSQGTATNSSTTLTNQFTTSGTAGSTYLGANANKFRCKAACVEMWSSQAPLNITGTVAFGVIPSSAQQSGSATNVDGLVSVLQHQTKLTADIVECLWFPGNRDSDFHHYVTLPSALVPEEYEDMNSIVFAANGLPVNTSYTFRVTWVAEWLPKASLEVASPVAGSGNTQRTSTVVNTLHRAHPGWYARLKSHGQQFAKIAGPVVRREVGNLARQYGPAMLGAVTGMLL